MNFEVIVQLKKEVLDPEGRAIQESLGRLGFRALTDAKVSKRYVLSVDEPEAKAKTTIEQIAKEYLANPVSETYEIRKL
jgi:phosphoribosylformylglycinamidine synthase PurS subunit